MKLEGKLFKANVVVQVFIMDYTNDKLTFVKELENTLILLCRELEIPIPLWLSKNTHEFAAFRQTVFFSDQFTEKVRFDRFQIRLN